MATARVTLTKAQAESAIGQKLIATLQEITADGQLADAEVQQLRALLNTSDANIPALDFLRLTIDEILEDKVITPSEMVSLYLAIERVLPKAEREEVEKKRSWTDASTSMERPDGAWRTDSVTRKQIEFIESLGGSLDGITTKGDASALIDSLLKSGRSPVSRRQMMVLRFWDEVHLAEDGKRAVTEWMDDLYSSDPDCRKAWQLWKEDNDDVGAQDDPSIVPLGIGEEYLAKVQRSGNRSASGCLGMLVILGSTIGALLIGLYAILATFP